MTAAAFVTPSHAEIPGLPPQLRVVPDERVQWEKWRDAVIAYRDLIWKQCDLDPDIRRTVIALCKDDPAYFLTVFGFIWEPRTTPGRPHGKIPFIPFPYQVRLWRFLDARMDDYESQDGLMPKPRGLGLSWSVMGWVDHGWLFKGPWDFGVASRTDEYVDKAGFKKALFWKLDFIIDGLPSWMVPEGYSTKRGSGNPNRTDAKMANPENGNTVTGESATVDLFRGDRLTGAYIDESAFYPNFTAAWDTLGGSTDHRFGGSSENGMSEFHKMWKLLSGNNPDTVFETFWWDNLYFDEAWYIREKKRYADRGDLAGFRQEYEKDPTAGAGEIVYPMVIDRTTGVFPYEPRAGQVYIFIDPGIRDATALHWLQFHAPSGRPRLIDSYENAGKTAAFYASILSGIPVSGPEGFAYDEADFAAMDFARTITDPIVYVGDPYGRNRGADGRSTVYETLAEEAKRLSNGNVFIHVLTSYAPDDRSYTGRRDALATMLPMMDFNDTPQVRTTLQALKEQRYKAVSASREIVNPTSDPVHGWGSHRVTALEFGAVHLHGGRRMGQTRKQVMTKRQGLGGQALGNRGGALTRTPAWSMGRAR